MDGSFTVSQIDPGAYTVTITAAGIKFTANDAQDRRRKETILKTPTLEVGNISENVTVTAGTDVINSANAELSNTVSPRQIKSSRLMVAIRLSDSVASRHGFDSLIRHPSTASVPLHEYHA